MNFPQFSHVLRQGPLEPFIWYSALFGLFIGSFLNVCIYRIPRAMFWHSHRSHCTNCGALIPIWLNLPIISYLFLKGKSSCCKKQISRIYPFVELLTSSLFLLTYWQYPFVGQFGGHTLLDVPQLIRYIFCIPFISVLIVCSMIDFQFKIIPDIISLPMIALGPIVALWHPDLRVYDSLLGVAMGLGIIYFIAWVYYFLRRAHGIGMGDAKLLAFIGGWMGYQAVFPTLFVGSILGSVIGGASMLISRKISLKTEIPFGPFLAVGALFYLLLASRVGLVQFISL